MADDFQDTTTRQDTPGIKHRDLLIARGLDPANPALYLGQGMPSAGPHLPAIPDLFDYILEQAEPVFNLSDDKAVTKLQAFKGDPSVHPEATLQLYRKILQRVPPGSLVKGTDAGWFIGAWPDPLGTRAYNAARAERPVLTDWTLEWAAEHVVSQWKRLEDLKLLRNNRPMEGSTAASAGDSAQQTRKGGTQAAAPATPAQLPTGAQPGRQQNAGRSQGPSADRPLPASPAPTQGRQQGQDWGRNSRVWCEYPNCLGNRATHMAAACPARRLVETQLNIAFERYGYTKQHVREPAVPSYFPCAGDTRGGRLGDRGGRRGGFQGRQSQQSAAMAAVDVYNQYTDPDFNSASAIMHLELPADAGPDLLAAQPVAAAADLCRASVPTLQSLSEELGWSYQGAPYPGMYPSADSDVLAYAAAAAANTQGQYDSPVDFRRSWVRTPTCQLLAFYEET